MPKPAICPRYPMLTLHSAEELQCLHDKKMGEELAEVAPGHEQRTYGLRNAGQVGEVKLAKRDVLRKMNMFACAIWAPVVEELKISVRVAVGETIRLAAWSSLEIAADGKRIGVCLTSRPQERVRRRK